MIDREFWQDPDKPVSGPAPKGTPGTWVIHYPGGRGGVVGAAVAQYLRDIQSNYLYSRGYSIGYNFGVAQDGSEWEIRGDDFNNAANAGKKRDEYPGENFNNVSQSIFIMVEDADEATPEAVATVNARIATHPDWDVVWHGQVDYTPCAGEGIIGQIQAGIIGHQPVVEPDPEPDPEPEPTPTPEENLEMLFIAKPTFKGATANTAWIVYYTHPGSGKRAERATNAHVSAAVALGVPIVDQDSKEQYDEVVARYAI